MPWQFGKYNFFSFHCFFVKRLGKQYTGSMEISNHGELFVDNSINAGGNFVPVMTVCEYNWLECPLALANYIWFEAVTDVVDCLANEGILWRVSRNYLTYFKTFSFRVVK